MNVSVTMRSPLGRWRTCVAAARVVALLLLQVGAARASPMLDVNPDLADRPPIEGIFQADFSSGDQLTGRSAGSDGTTGLGLLPQLNRVDLAGVYFDDVLPPTGFVVTGEQVRTGSNSELGSIQAGRPIRVPEPSTLLLFIAGAALTLVRSKSAPRRRCT